MPGGGARGASTAAVRGSAGAGGISGCPAFGTAGCAPVTCVAGGFAGEGGAGDAETGSGVFVPAAEDGSAAFGAGVDLQDRTASQRSAALVRMADGDGRAALTLAEEVWRAARKGEMFGAAKLQEVVQRRAPIYDKQQDSHYNLISALHKSVRGSDPDAALYYLCRMLDAGEDPLYIARRVVRMAVEDIGLADPQALMVANAARAAARGSARTPA